MFDLFGCDHLIPRFYFKYTKTKCPEFMWSFLVCTRKKKSNWSYEWLDQFHFVVLCAFHSQTVENGSNIFLNCPFFVVGTNSPFELQQLQWFYNASESHKSNRSVTHRNQSQNSTWIPQERRKMDKSVEKIWQKNPSYLSGRPRSGRKKNENFDIVRQ